MALKDYYVIGSLVVVETIKLTRIGAASELNWGMPSTEQEGVLQRRGFFAHPFTDEELDDIRGYGQLTITEDFPEDWRFPID